LRVSLRGWQERQARKQGCRADQDFESSHVEPFSRGYGSEDALMKMHWIRRRPCCSSSVA
jgi:hypothetical protein